MYLNQATDYAFRAVLFLAHQPIGKVVDSQAIARQEHIPTRFLLKIMPSLIQAGIIKSQRGAGGGYALNKTPAEISLLHVLEAVEGPINLNRCISDPSLCSKNGTPYCEIHSALDEIRIRLNAEFASHNFEQIMRKDPDYLKKLTG